jgi:hypothetical protein
MRKENKKTEERLVYERPMLNIEETEGVTLLSGSPSSAGGGTGGGGTGRAKGDNFFEFDEESDDETSSELNNN